jgi:hypothetical protein
MICTKGRPRAEYLVGGAVIYPGRRCWVPPPRAGQGRQPCGHPGELSAGPDATPQGYSSQQDRANRLARAPLATVMRRDRLDVDRYRGGRQADAVVLGAESAEVAPRGGCARRGRATSPSQRADARIAAFWTRSTSSSPARRSTRERSAQKVARRSRSGVGRVVVPRQTCSCRVVAHQGAALRRPHHPQPGVRRPLRTAGREPLPPLRST